MQPRWRLILGSGRGQAPRHGLVPDAATGALNMAVDHALLEGVQAGAAPTLRFYRWDPACLSFGRNQPARDSYDREAAAARGIQMVRRPTGGLAVLHQRELTYAVAAPVEVVGKPREAYQAINRALAAGLERLGVPVRLADRNGLSGPLAAGPCFHEEAPGEVLALGRKLVGSAQRYEVRCILQHGSILLDGDQSEVVELELTGDRRPMTADRRPPTADGSRREQGAGLISGSARSAGLGQGGEAGEWTSFAERAASGSISDSTSTSASALSATSLAAVLGEVPAVTDLVGALVAAFETELGVVLERGGLTDTELARLEALTQHYRSDDWTWRR